MKPVSLEIKKRERPVITAETANEPLWVRRPLWSAGAVPQEAAWHLVAAVCGRASPGVPGEMQRRASASPVAVRSS